MNDKEKLIRDEIDSWKTHLELDKFNYNVSFSSFITQVVIWCSLVIGVTSIIYSIDEISLVIRSLVTTFFLLVLILFFIRIFDNNKKELEKHKLSFFVREKMIRDRYHKLGVDRNKMDSEFELLKKSFVGNNN